MKKKMSRRRFRGEFLAPLVVSRLMIGLEAGSVFRSRADHRESQVELFPNLQSLPRRTTTNVTGYVASGSSPFPQCGVYLAPSSIPGAGLGMFAGKDFREHEEVLAGDLIVPILDRSWHTGEFASSLLWDEYTWWSGDFEHMTEEGEHVDGLSFGIGAAVNCDFASLNVETSYIELDTAGLHRSTDAGSGAFTPYHGRKTAAMKDIAAGDELFADYGEEYFTGREQYSMIPLSGDYDMADELFERFQYLSDGLANNGSNKNSQAEGRKELYNHMFFKLISSLKEVWPSRVLNAFPNDLDEVYFNGEKGTPDMAAAVNEKRRRDIAWLEEKGTCMDNIRPGRSTIAQAGRGAFAVRDIPAGGVVAPAPLLHVPNRDLLLMYDEKNDVPVHYQLAINYCFGHGDSTLLLCPYGALTALINHSRERPNARLVWNVPLSRNPEWFDQPLSQWSDADHSGLMMDFVATRDIRSGEEIFIDYGEEWEEAWQEHLANWKIWPYHHLSKDYKPGYEMDVEEIDLLRPHNDPHYQHGTMELFCREVFRRMSGLAESEEEGFNCRALYRMRDDSGKALYVAEVYSEYEDEANEMSYREVSEVLLGVPAEAFYFKDAPYSRDHAQTWSFRHDMRIPDDMMPDAWINMYDDDDDDDDDEYKYDIYDE